MRDYWLSRLFFDLQQAALVSEFRAGESRILSAWCAHRLRRRQVGWEIEAKQINLLERDQALRNPSALF